MMDFSALQALLLVTVSAAQSVKGLELRTRRGVAVRVRLDDPTGLLTAHLGKTRGANILVGAWSADGLFHPAATDARNNSARDLSVLIPYDSSVKLSVFSSFYRIRNQAGQQLASTGSQIPILIPAGAAPVATVFTIDGVTGR